jgi:hypothetical protein
MLLDTMQTGFVTWAPDYRSGGLDLAVRNREEAGDETFTVSTFDRLMAVPPKPANDNNPRPRVVGLMGYGGSGKSEVAKFLETQRFTRLHVKEPLRAMSAALLRGAGIPEPMVDRYLDGDLKREVIPELHRSGTEIQQFLGTEFGRNFCYPALWLDIWIAKAKAILASGGSVVQESVRFPNEAEAIRAIGGVIVRVERPGVGPLSSHASEVPPAEPDFVLHNNGSVVDLQWQTATWLRNAA